MSPLNEILSWLSSPRPRNFKKGAALYDKYGTNAFLKKRFAMGANKYNRALLLEELKEIARAMEKQQVRTVRKKREVKKLPPKRSVFKARLKETKQKKKKRVRKPAVNVEHYKVASKFNGLSQTEFAMLPKELKDIAVENVKLNNLAEKNFRLLRKRNAGKVIEHLSVEEIEENALQCEAIVEAMRINQMGWDEIRFWQQRKRFKREHPYFKKVDVMDELKSLSSAELKLRKKNRQSNLSNYRKKLEKSTDEKQKMKIKQKIDQWHIELEAIAKLLEGMK
jgi:hypothetical protein